MTDFAEITFCDGTCGLSPAEHERQHPNPLTVLRDDLAGVIGRTMILRTSTTEIADAVLAAIEDHPSLTIRHYAPTQDAYDAACRALEKHRQVGQLLAGRLAAHAHCDEHPESASRKDCPYCEDRTAFASYLTAGGRDPRPAKPTGRGITLSELVAKDRTPGD